MPLTPDKMSSTGKATFTAQPDGAVLVSGPNATPDVYTITAKTDLTNVTAVRLEVLPDDGLPAKGPGRAPNGNFVLNEFKLSWKEAGAAGNPKPLQLFGAVATFSQDQWAVAGAIDNNPATGWAVAPRFGETHTAYFEVKGGAFPKGAELTFTLEQRFPGGQHNIGKFRLSVTSSPPPLHLAPPPPALAQILAVPADKRTPEQKAQMTQFYQAQDAELARLRAAVAEYGFVNDPRLVGAQDLAWSLINSKAFLFNR